MTTPALTTDFTSAVHLMVKGMKCARGAHLRSIQDYSGPDTFGVKLDVVAMKDKGTSPDAIALLCKDIRTSLEAMRSASPTAKDHKWVQVDYNNCTVWEYDVDPAKRQC